MADSTSTKLPWAAVLHARLDLHVLCVDHLRSSNLAKELGDLPARPPTAQGRSRP